MIASSALVLLACASPFPQDAETVPNPLDLESEPTSLWAAMASGNHWVDLRLRAENVDASGMDDRAMALTLRGAVGWMSLPYEGFSVALEMEGVGVIGADTYNDTFNGETSRPVIADPQGGELNQAWARYELANGFAVQVGRQHLDLGNGRLVGSEPWRQTDRTYDAATLSGELGGDLRFMGAYIQEVHGVTGLSTEADTLLLRATYPLGDLGRTEAYSYYVDLEDALFPATHTVGARAELEIDVGDRGLDFQAEFANQRDSGDNPNRVDAGYWHISLGSQFGPLTYKVGSEILQGSTAAGNNFTTPLGSVHAFNGLADMFATTPGLGLDDLYHSVSGELAGFQFEATYHQFRSYRSSQKYGTELDLTVGRTLASGLRTGVGTADYKADTFGVDTLKAWVWMAFSF